MLVMDSDRGGAAFVYHVRSREIAQHIQNAIPKHAEDLCDFLALIDTYNEKGLVKFLWDASSIQERQWIDELSCEYVIDVRVLGEEIVDAITCLILRGI
ncbi:MAG: hypothetical protein EOM50_16660 [Erysipelotrichia bacterium]|nr:hypothetical protein [Erysipelotrichia bacterium]